VHYLIYDIVDDTGLDEFEGNLMSQGLNQKNYS